MADSLIGEIIACHECDHLHHYELIPVGAKANCLHCGNLLYRHVPNSLNRSLALYITALILFVVANTFPFLSLELGGRVVENILFSSGWAMYEMGMGELGILIFLTSIFFPFTVIVGMIYLLVPACFVKRAWRVDRADLMAEILEKAFHLAESGQPGPVLVNVPMDIFSEVIPSDSFDRIIDNTRALVKPSIDDETARQIVERLAKAEKPVAYVGGGILLAKASEELREFVEHMGLPVAHSLMGKGALRDDHPLVMGMTGFWGTELVNQSCLKADYIFAVGTRFKEADCSSWYPGYTFNIPGSKVIHIDIEPQEIGRNYPTEIGVVADAKAALRVLTRVAKEMYPDGFPRTEKRAEIAEFRTTFKASNEEMQTSSAFPMMPERILADARKALPEDAIITTDVGWNKNGVGQQFDILTPGSILTPGGFATMGFGPPGAIGAKLAAPDRVVISLVGDGGFGQNPSMLATAVELNLGIIWLVMNNNAFGTIAGLQKAHYGLTYGTTFPGSAAAPANGPGYADIAKAYGAEGLRLSSADELLPALQAAIASGKPTVLDVPMINNPTPTTGHWNILDIYSPDKDVSHVAT